MHNGEIIARLRTRSGLTQEALAQRLFVTQQLVSRWENGSRRPDRVSLEKMAEIFSVPADDIFPAEQSVLSELSDCLGEKTPADVSAAVNGFLGTLPEKERRIFLRRYYFLDDSKQIAALTGMKDNQVRAVLSRTRKKLKRYLSEGDHD